MEIDEDDGPLQDKVCDKEPNVSEKNKTHIRLTLDRSVENYVFEKDIPVDVKDGNSEVWNKIKKGDKDNEDNEDDEDDIVSDIGYAGTLSDGVSE